MKKSRAKSICQPGRIVLNNKYLASCGYVRSLAENKAIDAEGNPVPWYVYPAIDLCKERATADLSVFEFGCGHGALWRAGHAARVTIVEHNRDWLQKIRPSFPENARAIYRAFRPAASTAIFSAPCGP